MDPRVQLALTEMEERIGQRVTVGELARSAQLSRSRFAHLFREQTGCTPMQHLFEIRMERARALLERTSLTIGEIMTCVGYSDPSHFARDFRLHHERAPREYRLEFFAVNSMSR